MNRQEYLRKKIKFKVFYRGTLETTKILSDFLEKSSLQDDELEIFEELLDSNDLDIYEWILNKNSPVKFENLIQKISSY